MAPSKTPYTDMIVSEVSVNMGFSGLNVAFDPTIFIQIIPLLLNLLSLCKKQVPPNPNPAATPSEQKAYEANWNATQGWRESKNRYRPALLNHVAHEIAFKQGLPMTTARELAVESLDRARETPLDILAKAIAENS